MSLWDSFKQGFEDARNGVIKDPDELPAKAEYLYDYCCKIADDTYEDKDYNQYYEEDLARLDLNGKVDLNQILPPEFVRKLRALVFKQAYEQVKNNGL